MRNIPKIKRLVSFYLRIRYEVNVTRTFYICFTRHLFIITQILDTAWKKEKHTENHRRVIGRDESSWRYTNPKKKRHSKRHHISKQIQAR